VVRAAHLEAATNPWELEADRESERLTARLLAEDAEQAALYVEQEAFWAAVDARDAARGLAPIGTVDRMLQSAAMSASPDNGNDFDEALVTVVAEVQARGVEYDADEAINRTIRAQALLGLISPLSWG